MCSQRIFVRSPNRPAVRPIPASQRRGLTFAIRDFAAELRLSTGYLQRSFKNETGIFLGEWLNEQRLKRAAYLLSNSYLSIKEITHAIGYEHTSSFIRAFERRFLQAPVRYRKQHEGKYEGEGSKRIQAA
jgi:AraC-like DNA-binding protein